MDVNTGEVLAMVSLPDFDPSHPGTPDPNHPCTIAVADRMVSIASRSEIMKSGRCSKIFTTAMGLDCWLPLP